MTATCCRDKVEQTSGRCAVFPQCPGSEPTPFLGLRFSSSGEDLLGWHRGGTLKYTPAATPVGTNEFKSCGQLNVYESEAPMSGLVTVNSPLNDGTVTTLQLCSCMSNLYLLYVWIAFCCLLLLLACIAEIDGSRSMQCMPLSFYNVIVFVTVLKCWLWPRAHIDIYWQRYHC